MMTWGARWYFTICFMLLVWLATGWFMDTIKEMVSWWTTPPPDEQEEDT